MSRILFLTTAHQYDDDRIFYHQAQELHARGHQVKICSLSSVFTGTLAGIEIESREMLHLPVQEKISILREICADFMPQCIICSEPLAVVAARQFARKHTAAVIYDVTEWYPSQRMLQRYPHPAKIFHFFRFFLIHLYAGAVSNRLIFGEKYKQFPLKQLFLWKKSLRSTYYPDQKYISPAVKPLTPGEITLAYTGSFSREKGIEQFFEAADVFRKNRPDIRTQLLLVGFREKGGDYFEALLCKYKWESLIIKPPAAFEDFTDSYAEADLCFDLRPATFENHHCLPIKLFYYLGSGKPVIYSDLKAIRKEAPVHQFGFLADPGNAEEIAAKIAWYVDHPDQYLAHARAARQLFLEKFHRGILHKDFVEFVEQAIP